MNARIDFFRNQVGKDKWPFDYPLMEYLHARVLEADEGQVKMQFSVEKYMLNPIGILHGGIAATILDELMGAAGFLQGRPTGYATINMNVDYRTVRKQVKQLPGRERSYVQAKLLCTRKPKYVMQKAGCWPKLLQTSLLLRFRYREHKSFHLWTKKYRVAKLPCVRTKLLTILLEWGEKKIILEINFQNRQLQFYLLH
jgi:hypothetical protein